MNHQLDSCGPIRRAGCIALFAMHAFVGVGHSQVINDGSLGTNGPGLVSNLPNATGGIDYFVTEADGDLVGGTNLFHSFDRLDLGGTDAAIYQGSASIQNLITRVTGGQSSIDGTIRSEIAGAKLFLMNADGFLFGENAKLDVSGAVVISTAHEVNLGAAGRFDVRNAGGDLLTVDPPSSFGFLAPLAPIMISGSQLEGADGTSLALLGGDLILRGARTDGQPGLLSVRGGRIDLASLASSGVVRVVEGTAPDLLLDGVGTRGDISITDDFVLSTSGLSGDPLDFATRPAAGSGPIFVRADDLLLEDSEIRVLTLTNEAADRISIDLTGDLTIRRVAGDLRAAISNGSGLTILAPPSQVTAVIRDVDSSLGLVRDFFICGGSGVCGVTYFLAGSAGDIDVSAANVFLENGGQIISRSELLANAGGISLVLDEDLTIQGRAANGTRSGVFGNAVGSGDQRTISLRLPNGTLRMDDFGVVVIENGEDSLSGGAPGAIDIAAARLDMSGNARIDSSTRGAGNGGDLTLAIRDSTVLRGTNDIDEFTGISTLSQPGSTGNAGTIRLSTGSLTMTDGARLAARPVGTGALGDAGSLDIAVDRDLLLRGGILSTESEVAGGGDIDLAVGGLIDLVDSAITTSVTRGLSSGGNVRIQPASQAVILEGSRIVARADRGAGGSIQIVTNTFLTDGLSVVSASSNSGVDGVERIDTLQGETEIELPELPVEPIDTSALLREPCAQRNPGVASSFVVDTDPGPMPVGSDLFPAYLGRRDRLGAEAGAPAASMAAPGCRR